MTASVLGIIGGSGIYDLPGLANVVERRIESPWGEPSAALRIGDIAGLPVVFLPRHDKGHRLSPSDINYRANIDVLKRAGVTDLVSLSACGSFKEELPPGTFVLIDQFVDRTYNRASSFFGKGCVAHVSMAHPVSPRLRVHLAAAAEAEGIAIARGGTYVCMEGPQFSTLAESLTYKQLGYAVIGMTNMPEAKLAREAEICYATVAMVTDFDCWHPDHDAVTVQDIIKVLNANADKAKRLVARLAQGFSRAGTSRARSAPTARSTTPSSPRRRRAIPPSWPSSTPWRDACRVAPMRPHDEVADEVAMTPPELEFDLRAAIRTIPDYPSPGIMFRDITTLLGNARAFRRAVDELVQPWAGFKIDKVAGIEARGFILGGAVAHQISAGFVPIRKKGKLPYKRVTIGYSLEYGSDEMEMHEDGVAAGRAGDPGRRPRRHRRHRAGGGQAAAPDGRRGARRLLHHRPAGTRRRRQAPRARRAGAHADLVRGALRLVGRVPESGWPWTETCVESTIFQRCRPEFHSAARACGPVVAAIKLQTGHGGAACGSPVSFRRATRGQFTGAAGWGRRFAARRAARADIGGVRARALRVRRHGLERSALRRVRRSCSIRRSWSRPRASPSTAPARKPWFGPERASAMTVARAQLTPPDDGRFSLASVGLVDWQLDKIEQVGQIGDLVAPAAGGHDVLIYVHGYNTTFETAALDAARLSDGIKFVGETMVFSWPSRASLLDYGYDRESAMWSRDALQQVLDGLIASPLIGHIHIVAHSIGTMLTMEALRQLYAQLGEEAVNRIGAVVFASPDIDMDGFSSSVQRIGPLAPKITVIAATNDRALAVSRWIAGGITRVGAAEKRAARAHGNPGDRRLPAGLGHHQSRPVPVQRPDPQSHPRRRRRAPGARGVSGR